jgi:PD-(D/E)XK nuclease superfamily domain
LKAKSRGTKANQSGTELKQFIASTLEACGYVFVSPNRFLAARILEQPIYSERYYIGLNIYDNQQYCDIIVFHPHKWPNNLAIESFSQQSSGSVDEKLPYIVLNILGYQTPTILVLDGGGYNKGAEKWVCSQAGTSKFLAVYNKKQFVDWIKQGNL